MSKSKIKSRWLVALSELGLVLGAVLVFLGFLMLLINFYFPQGTDLIADRNSSPASLLVRDLYLEITDDRSSREDLFVGEILSIQRRVQRRGADSLNWNAAIVGDKFADNDAVQTFARSTALLKVDEQIHLTIGQNSLIVFDKQEVDPFTSRQGSALVMVDGELSGRLSSGTDQNFQFGVQLPNSDVTLTSTDSASDVDFLITVNDDQSTTVNIHSGTAIIVGRNGVRTVIDQNESITIDSTGTEFAVSKLPSSPRSTGPVNQKTVAYRNVPETIDFSWHAVVDADRYHIIVARDVDFADRVVDDDVIGTSFTHGALGPGTYYWYVRSRVAWSQSRPGPTRRIKVIQDTSPPFLELDAPPTMVVAGPWRLQGRTESNAAIFVDDAPARHQGGRIDYPIELRPGANIIVVKAMDDVGNLNYASISVNAK